MADSTHWAPSPAGPTTSEAASRALRKNVLTPGNVRVALRPSAQVPAAALPTGPEPKVSMFVVRPLVDIVERAGVPRAEILRASGIPEAALAEDETGVPRFLVERICELAQRPTVDPALGLRWVEHLTVHTFGPVSHTLMHAESLRQALQLVLRYEGLFCDQRIFGLEEDGQTATIRLVDWNVRAPAVRRFMHEMSVAGFALMLTIYEARIARVCFAHAPPDHRADYVQLFGDAVEFDQPFTGLVFERAALDRENPHFDAEVCAALAGVLERRLLRATEDAPFAARVREILKDACPARLNIEMTARRLGLSERSLRRRLAAEGVSFREIQESVFTSLAQELLQERRFTIKETAHAMGFSDASAFHRAFKRWTGTTPRAFGTQ